MSCSWCTAWRFYKEQLSVWIWQTERSRAISHELPGRAELSGQGEMGSMSPSTPGAECHEVRRFPSLNPSCASPWAARLCLGRPCPQKDSVWVKTYTRLLTTVKTRSNTQHPSRPRQVLHRQAASGNTARTWVSEKAVPFLRVGCHAGRSEEQA